ncbi:MAG: CAP domain-containing protein [Burkholderiaceae bacterium]
MSKPIKQLLQSLALIAACALPCAHAQALNDELAADTVALVNLVRQRLDTCRETGGITKSDLQNAAIVANDRPSLAWNPKLAAIAARHAANMADNGFFDHVDPQGRTIGKRTTAGGYKWKIVGENIASGQADLAEAMRGWLQSAAHCRNLIDARFTEIGLAKVASNDEYGTYWVMVLGRPQAGEQAPAPLRLITANASAAASRLLAALN